MRSALVVTVASLLVAGCIKQAPPSLADQTSGPASVPGELGTPWTFTILNEQRKVIGSLKVRFTDEKALSCISGEWKRLTVLSFESSGEPAFPGRDPLSYALDGHTLTIGRNEICDAYVMLKGDVTSVGMTGDYFSLGLGGTHQLGYVQGTPNK